MKKYKTKSFLCLIVSVVSSLFLKTTVAEACDLRYDTTCINKKCYMGLCVGDKVFRVSKGARLAKVLAITRNHKFVLAYFDNRHIGKGWNRSDLAVTSGCYYQVCVGKSVHNLVLNSRATTVGIEENGKFVLDFDDKKHGIIGGWTTDEFVLER